MALTLYDFPTSGNARKVRLLLAELGLEFEHVLVPRARPRPDWYLEVNPFGGVPAIRDGDLVLAESQAILRYLAGRAGRRRLGARRLDDHGLSADSPALPRVGCGDTRRGRKATPRTGRPGTG